MFISLHMLLAFGGGYIVLSSIANALDPNDRNFYRFMVRFLRSLTMNLAPYAEKELHISLPAVPVTTQVEVQTQTSVNPL